MAMPDPWDLLTTTSAAWGLPLDQAQLAQLKRYAAQLRDWNTRLNLTAIDDQHGIVVRHFLDSLRLAQSWGAPPHNLIDIGSGAGFPGLPLKLLHPALELTLVESIEKKAAFLRHVVADLGLTGVQVVVARAEVIGHDPAHRERYALVTARAVAELRVLAEYGLPLCHIGGRLLAPKGLQIDDELRHAQSAITLLGGGVPVVEPVLLPDLEPRTLVVVPKVAATPPRYPRGPGIPARRPL